MLLILLSIFGHCLVISSFIFGGNTLPQKRLNEPAPSTPVSEEKKTPISEELSKTATKTATEDDILSEKTCEDDLVDEADRPTVFEKVKCVSRPAVDNPKRLSRSKQSKKKSSGENGAKKNKKRGSRQNRSGGGVQEGTVPSGENIIAPDEANSDDKDKKNKKKKKLKSLFTKDGQKKLGSKDSKEKTEQPSKDLKGNSSETDAKLKALKGKE